MLSCAKTRNFAPLWDQFKQKNLGGGGHCPSSDPLSALSALVSQSTLSYTLFTTFQHLWLSTHSRGMFSNINVSYISLKNTFSGLQFRCWEYGSVFILLAVVVSQISEMMRNSEKIRICTSRRSSKVIDLGVSRKCIFDVPFGRIAYTVFEILML